MKKNNKKAGRKVLSEAKGYTIMETMIAVSLFIVIVMMGMGALLNANLLHQKSQSMRSIIDNLSFVMEDMSRNLRTGIDYHCIDDGNLANVDPHSCPTNPLGGGISFKSGYDGSQWVYYISYNPNDSSKYSIFRKVGVSASTQLTPDEIEISSVSSFTVSGAEKGGPLQPFVTIKLVGKIKLPNNVETPFSLQTSVSQRVIDI